MDGYHEAYNGGKNMTTDLSGISDMVVELVPIIILIMLVKYVVDMLKALSK